MHSIFRQVFTCSFEKYSITPSSITIICLSFGICFVQKPSSASPSSILQRSLSLNTFLLTAIWSARSTSNQVILPLSTCENLLSKPQPRFMQVASGYLAISSFNLSLNNMVLATTPSCDIKGSNLLTSTPSVSIISLAFSSFILAFALAVSLAFIASGISAVSCISPNFNSIKLSSVSLIRCS